MPEIVRGLGAAAILIAVVALAELGALRRVNVPQPDARTMDVEGVAVDDAGADAGPCTAANSLLTDSRSLFTWLGLFLLDPLRRWERAFIGNGS
jgi:hypothetical protein